MKYKNTTQSLLFMFLVWTRGFPTTYIQKGDSVSQTSLRAQLGITPLGIRPINITMRLTDTRHEEANSKWEKFPEIYYDKQRRDGSGQKSEDQMKTLLILLKVPYTYIFLSKRGEALLLDL